LLGLCAILFGKLWLDGGLPIPVAAGLTLVLGAVAGGLNATLITALRLPPLIVTLGTYSLFRGLAEAITRGSITYTDFPETFLFVGQERWLGLPTQAWIFFAVALAVWLLVHRTSHLAANSAPSASRPRAPATPVSPSAVGSPWSMCWPASSPPSPRSSTPRASAKPKPTPAPATNSSPSPPSSSAARASSAAPAAVHGTLLGVAAIAVLKNGLACLPVVMR
jgi:predicted ABC-type sugar transport system permease subunit